LAIFVQRGEVELSDVSDHRTDLDQRLKTPKEGRSQCLLSPKSRHQGMGVSLDPDGLLKPRL